MKKTMTIGYPETITTKADLVANNDAKALRVMLKQCYCALNDAPNFTFRPTSDNPCQFKLNPRSRRASSYDLAERVRFVLEQTK